MLGPPAPLHLGFGHLGGGIRFQTLCDEGDVASFKLLDALCGQIELAVLLGSNVIAVPPLLVAHGRFSAAERNTKETFLYVGEGMNSSPAVTRDQNGIISYANAGKVQASTLPQDMRLQRMLGHLTTLIPVAPRDVLVIACGAGVTAGAAT